MLDRTQILDFLILHADESQLPETYGPKSGDVVVITNSGTEKKQETLQQNPVQNHFKNWTEIVATFKKEQTVPQNALHIFYSCLGVTENKDTTDVKILSFLLKTLEHRTRARRTHDIGSNFCSRIRSVWQLLANFVRGFRSRDQHHLLYRS
jgi:hypothetical protein